MGFNILMLKILSFDCANRSLAVCYVSIDTKTIPADNRTASYHPSIDNCKLLKAAVYDVTNDTDTVKRTCALKKVLCEVDAGIDDKVDIVLIEYQMSLNDKSRCVSQQLVYHYVDTARVYLVGPSLKNTVYFSPELKHSYYTGKYMSKYTANKNHAKANFLAWINVNNYTVMIKSIAKKNIDDIADAFMQIAGWTTANSSLL